VRLQESYYYCTATRATNSIHTPREKLIVVPEWMGREYHLCMYPSLQLMFDLLRMETETWFIGVTFSIPTTMWYSYPVHSTQWPPK
jgi:hypothetical protein